jgi:hypothetical protein
MDGTRNDTAMDLRARSTSYISLLREGLSCSQPKTGFLNFRAQQTQQNRHYQQTTCGALSILFIVTVTVHVKKETLA